MGIEKLCIWKHVLTMLNVDDALGKLETVMALEDWQKCVKCSGYSGKPCYVASKISITYKSGGQYE